MSVTRIEGPAILIGYQYRLRIETDTALFPVGVVLLAQVRATPLDAAVLATLSTSDGSLIRQSDTLLDLVIPAAVTALMTAGSVTLDVVRTDVQPDLHLGFALDIPVMMPVTRGL
jgi:hypothetical protein